MGLARGVTFPPCRPLRAASSASGNEGIEGLSSLRHSAMVEYATARRLASFPSISSERFWEAGCLRFAYAFRADRFALRAYCAPVYYAPYAPSSSAFWHRGTAFWAWHRDFASQFIIVLKIESCVEKNRIDCHMIINYHMTKRLADLMKGEGFVNHDANNRDADAGIRSIPKRERAARRTGRLLTVWVFATLSFEEEKCQERTIAPRACCRGAIS